MQLARQGKISLEEDDSAVNLITLESCNVINDDAPQEKSSSDKETLVTTKDCMLAITFTDEDLELGSDPHNRPLFVSGYTLEHKVNRILVDGGSAVNILSLRTLKQIGLSTDELLTSRLMIQGFNHEGQRALGTIRLDLVMDDMTSSVLFHVIDARTSYNMLLGRPWLHENGVIPSTWHQCLKYCQDGMVKKIVGDNKPFVESESHFADAKYYLSGKEAMKVVDETKGKKEEDKIFTEEKSLDILTMPLTKIDMEKPIPPPLKGFVRPSQGCITEHGEMSEHEIAKSFGPKAFSLLIKAGYNPQKGSKLEESLPKMGGQQGMGTYIIQKASRKNGHVIPSSKDRLGFVSQLVRIAIKRASANHINEEEA